VDEIDWSIVNILKENSRTTNSNIGRKLNISEGTVRKRIKNMLKSGVIKKFTVIVKNNGIEGMILLTIDSKKAKHVSDIITKKFDEVYEFTGKYDIALQVSCSSLVELNNVVDELRSIDGIKETNTLVRLH
jgi:Lrp/AsnC family transcriptional regulator of lysine biosynthesis